MNHPPQIDKPLPSSVLQALPGRYLPHTKHLLDGLEQGSANFFWKGSESKYFRLSEPYGFSCNYSILGHGMRAAIDNVHTNEQGWAPEQFYLQKQVLGHGL